MSTARPTDLLRRAAWPLLLVAAVLALLAPGLSSGRLLAWRDALREYAPLRPLVAAALREGRLPLWDPFDGTGTPLFAQLIHGVLHPPALLLALAAPGAPLDALLVADVLLAALGAYAAARALQASPPAAAAAGVGYAGSGYVLSGLANLPFLAGAASLPWLVAAGALAGRGARLSGVAVALAFAATLLSGDLHAAAVGAPLALALAHASGGRPALPRALAGVGVGALLAGVQLLPAWRFVGLTSRALSMPQPLREQWALLPWRLPELVAPGWLAGRPDDLVAPVFQALEPGSPSPTPFAASVFVGAALVAAAAAAGRVRQARPLLVAVPLLTWLALGHRLGAQQLLQGVPGWGGLRYAEKLVGPLTLALALLAALGLPRLAAASPVRRLGALAGAAGLLVAALALPATGQALAGALLPPAAAAAGRAQALTGLLHLAAALAALAGLLALARRAPRALAPGFAALVLAEALLAAPFALHPTPGPLTPPRPPAAAPPGPRLHVPEAPDAEPGVPGSVERSTRAAVALGVPGFNVLSGVDNVDLYSGLVSLRLEWVRGTFEAEPWMWRRYGVTHVALPAGPRSATGRAATEGGEPAGGDELVQRWAVPHRPWASFAPAARAAAGPGEALAAVRAAEHADDPAAIVEAPAAPPTAAGRVLSVARGAEALAVEAEADGPALLVVNDAWWPGWVAELDGAPAAILPADALVRAVPFPPGRHRLVMRYDPPEVRRGLAVSALGLALLLALATLEERRHRARPEPAAG